MTKARDLADFVAAGNPLADGTIDVADINGVTATTDEINILDGVTATTTELNILDGVTATTSELNILDGVTATTAELNYVDGVTSNVQTQLDAKVDLAGDTMTGALILSADPTVALGAATKQYVDTIAAAGIHYHTAVRVETPSNLNATYDNGTSGVGATLTNAGTNAAITIDGVALSLNDRVLVYNQTNAAHNGIYTVTTVGDGSTAWVLTRATDADSYGASDSDALGEGDAFFVLEGDTGAGELYVMNTTGTITFGTTDITFSVIAETAVYSAGNGLNLDGTQFNINTSITSKLDGIEAGADVTDTANVTAAGALMDSELTNITAVKALNQGVATTDSPTFNTVTLNGNLDMQDGYKILLGTDEDLQIYHTGLTAWYENSVGHLYIRNYADDQDIYLQTDNGSGSVTNYVVCQGSTGETKLHHYGAEKLATKSGGVVVTGSVTSSGGFALNAANYMEFSNNTYGRFVINSGERARIEADGDFHADGDVIAYSTTISDPRLKTDIQKIEGALDKLCTLSGYTFTYTPDGKESAGVMSTEVAKVLPSAIRPKKLPLKTGDEETVYDTVQYDQLHGLLIEAIKELREEVADLKAKIEG